MNYNGDNLNLLHTKQPIFRKSQSFMRLFWARVVTMIKTRETNGCDEDFTYLNMSDLVFSRVKIIIKTSCEFSQLNH